MIGRVGVKYDEIEIWPMYESFMNALAANFNGLAEDTTEENLQARIRGTLLMALSNKTGKLVLTTGNKSEMTTGYCTLYGDMAGGFAVLKDVAKTLVFALCRWRNTQEEMIPERIITRPPSAELRPDQKDQDSLPPYEVLDAIMARYVEENLSAEQIIADGFAEADVRKVVRLLKINEYKRRQAPVGPRYPARLWQGLALPHHQQVQLKVWQADTSLLASVRQHAKLRAIPLSLPESPMKLRPALAAPPPCHLALLAAAPARWPANRQTSPPARYCAKTCKTPVTTSAANWALPRCTAAAPTMPSRNCPTPSIRWRAPPRWRSMVP
jgi:NAD+ synthetase